MIGESLYKLQAKWLHQRTLSLEILLLWLNINAHICWKMQFLPKREKQEKFIFKPFLRGQTTNKYTRDKHLVAKEVWRRLYEKGQGITLQQS